MLPASARNTQSHVGGGGGLCLFVQPVHGLMCDRSMDIRGGIELLLSTVNGVAVPAQEESYPIAGIQSMEEMLGAITDDF